MRWRDWPQDDWFQDLPSRDVVVDVLELVTGVVVEVTELVTGVVEVTELVTGGVEVPELVVTAGGSFTVMVWAALVIGVPVASCAVTVSVALGRP